MKALFLFCLLGILVFSSCEKFIVYPEYGKYGQNILSDGVTEVKTDYFSSDTVFAENLYSITADVPKGQSLMVKIKDVEMGIYNETEYIGDNKRCMVSRPLGFQHIYIHYTYSTEGKNERGINGIFDILIIEDGREARYYASEDFKGDVQIGFHARKKKTPYFVTLEFFENGSETPTRVKQIKVVE